MNLRRFAILAMAAVVLFGCGIQRLNIRDTPTIPDGSGVIVARVILNDRNAPANHPYMQVTAMKQSKLLVVSLMVTLLSGENFSVMTLPAGKYSWVGIYMGSKHSAFRGQLPFEVKPGKINYIGDLVISMDWSNASHYGLRVGANQDRAEKYMKVVYPELTSHYPMVASLTVDQR